MSRTFRNTFLDASEDTYVQETINSRALWFAGANAIRARLGRPLIDVPDYDAMEQELRAWYRSTFRDGQLHDTPRKQGFKRAAKKTVRQANKKLCHLVLRDEWDEQPYPIYQEGKVHIWDWW